MNIQTHLRAINESIEEIEDSIAKGLTKRQRTIGFHTSAAAVDMLETILHKRNLIDPGFVIKHEWLNSDKKIAEKLPFDFPEKNKIIQILKKIEDARNKLCYGRERSEEELKEVVRLFFELKELFKKGGYDEP